MTSRRSGRPAKEDIAGCLHHPLSANYALTGVVQSLRIEMLFDHRRPCLFDLQEHGLPQFVHHQQNQAASPDAPDPHDLEGQILRREMSKERTPVVAKRFDIVRKHALDQRSPVPQLDPIVIGFEQRVSAVYVKHAWRHVTQGPGIGLAIEFGHLLEHAVVCAARGFFHAPA